MHPSGDTKLSSPDLHQLTKTSVCGLGVPGTSGFDPQGTAGDVDEIPEAPTGGDFVLPLLHRRPTVRGGREGSFELVVPRSRRGDIGPGA